ncbi:hypothetical protein QBC39DRAFT_162998 [Podospora conica]|nr:hypothetical protein QBC39DRAFT_162998 [Schizothecium conicum]
MDGGVSDGIVFYPPSSSTSSSSTSPPQPLLLDLSSSTSPPQSLQLNLSSSTSPPQPLLLDISNSPGSSLQLRQQSWRSSSLGEIPDNTPTANAISRTSQIARQEIPSRGSKTDPILNPKTRSRLLVKPVQRRLRQAQQRDHSPNIAPKTIEYRTRPLQGTLEFVNIPISRTIPPEPHRQDIKMPKATKASKDTKAKAKDTKAPKTPKAKAPNASKKKPTNANNANNTDTDDDDDNDEKVWLKEDLNPDDYSLPSCLQIWHRRIHQAKHRQLHNNGVPRCHGSLQGRDKAPQESPRPDRRLPPGQAEHPDQLPDTRCCNGL